MADLFFTLSQGSGLVLCPLLSFPRCCFWGCVFLPVKENSQSDAIKPFLKVSHTLFRVLLKSKVLTQQKLSLQHLVGWLREVPAWVSGSHLLETVPGKSSLRSADENHFYTFFFFFCSCEHFSCEKSCTVTHRFITKTGKKRKNIPKSYVFIFLFFIALVERIRIWYFQEQIKIKGIIWAAPVQSLQLTGSLGVLKFVRKYSEAIRLLLCLEEEWRLN